MSLPDGYENAPPNIRQAFLDGCAYARRCDVGDRYAATSAARTEGARVVWDRIMKGMMDDTLTVSMRYLESIRPELPLGRTGGEA